MMDYPLVFAGLPLLVIAALIITLLNRKQKQQINKNWQRLAYLQGRLDGVSKK